MLLKPMLSLNHASGPIFTSISYRCYVALIGMTPKLSMITAAQRAEYDYYRNGLSDTALFVPTPDLVIKAMLAAALKLIEPTQAPAPAADEPNKPAKLQPRIVEAQKPRRR